jgi:cell division protein FtsB
MNAESNTPKFKIIIGILSFLLIALSVYTVILFNDNKETVSGLEEQKSTIESELEELIADYDIVIQDNEIKDQDLIEARTRIVVLLDSVKDAEANLALIRRYKREINKLKDERVLLFKKADSLIAANQMLAIERDSTYLALNETIKVVDSVTGENLALSNTIKEASVVKAVDLSGSAVIIRNSGRIVDTKRSSRADKVRTCFTLTPNIIAEKGDRLLYIQVFNPKKKLLGEKGSLIIDDQALNYSKSTKVFYENEELDVCVLVDANEGDLIQGRYVINVFDGPNLVATSSMILK